MKLRDIAHTRAGDRGNDSIITVIVYNEEDFPYIEKT
jgi:hypothetical protein